MLLAPYLGEARLIREMIEANAGAFPRDDPVHAVWDWIARYDPEHRALPRLYLGYGTHDRFAQANALLARRLPASQVRTVSGGHDWRTWKHLWDGFLESWSVR